MVFRGLPRACWKFSLKPFCVFFSCFTKYWWPPIDKDKMMRVLSVIALAALVCCVGGSAWCPCRQF